MCNPKITVVIPTRERADVLRASLRTVTTQDYDNLRIIVSDNFSHDATRDIVSSADDKRVQYLNTGRRIGMSKNWEFALQHVSDGWVTILGDDDGLLPDSIRDIAEIIRSSGVSAIRSKVCSYYWPSLIEKEFGRLAIPLSSGIEIRDCRIWLEKVLRGRCSYLELPMLYNGGYVSVSVLNSIKSKTGSIFRSPIPDVYSAIAIASVLDRYAYSSAPTAINGSSKHSTGTSTFSGTKKSVSSPAAKFASEDNLPFHGDIPLCADGTYPPSLQTLVYESYLQSSALRPRLSVSMHAEQLKIILATSGEHVKQINEWGRRFADTHDLDFWNISLKSKVAKIISTAAAVMEQIAVEWNTWNVGSAELLIADVYDASLVAKGLWLQQPSPWKVLPLVVTRLVEKILRRRNYRAVVS